VIDTFPAGADVTRTLYVSDLDGTLLRPDASLSPETRDVVSGLLDRQVLFTVASARSVVSIRECLGDLPISLPIIGFNGGTVNEWRTGRVLRSATLSTEVAQTIVSAAQQVGLSPMVSTTGARDWLRYTTSVNAGMDAFITEREAAGDGRLKRVSTLDEALCDPVLCTTIIGDAMVLEALAKDLSQRIGDAASPQLYENPYGPHWSWLTYNGPDANKARGIDALLDVVGLDPAKTRVVVFGDAHNDVEMFARADHAVATQNAAPAVRALADEVIGSNAEDAVARWLRDQI
jgi:5-amino-6-(5-phospho-D-ribitylamino)uracil phosphatase